MKNLSNKHILIGVSSIFFILLFFVTSILYKKNIDNNLLKNNQLASSTNNTSDEVITRITIPSINVDAPIEYVGLTKDGAMDTPKKPMSVGWFYPGTYPGENGSSVLAGHRSWKGGVPAVFDNLDDIRKGDKIYIENNKGQTITFLVRETRIYDKNANADDVFTSSSGVHLNLITCVGYWDSATNSSADRLIVYADMVN